MRSIVKLGLGASICAALWLTASGGGAQPSPPAGAGQAPAAPTAIPTPNAMPTIQPPAQPAAPAPARIAIRPASPPPAPPPAAAQPGARLAPGAPMPPAEVEAFVDGVVREAMRGDHIAGVAVAVVQNGQVVLKKGYGFAGPNRPVDPAATVFRLGSISKTFTWISVMKDAEAGRIRLDTPINLYLPERAQVKDQGFKQPVLVRDLMNHSGGFGDRILGQLIEENPARVRPLALYLRQERPRRVREPGALPIYSNYGAVLAGEAVSWVDGRPFQDIVEAEILRPLQMSHTTFREPYPARSDLPAPMPAGLAREVSTGYRWSGAGFAPQGFEYASQVAPAVAASSTAGDMARYMLMILNGGQLDGAVVYGADTARGFRTASIAAAPGVAGVDHGFLEFAMPGGYRGQGHGGDTLWFHASMVTVPELNLGVFVATNTDTGAGLAASLPDRIVARFYASPSETPRPGASGLAGQGPVYDGVYLADLRPYGGLEQFYALLTGEAKVRTTPDGRLVIATRGGAQAWVPDGASGRFVRVDSPETSAFRIENGRATRWYAPSGVQAYDRIGPLRRIRTLALAAAMAALAAIANLAGPFTRDRREFRETPTQARAGQLQTAIAVLWLVAMGLFAVFMQRAGNPGYLMYAWPTPYLLIGSACALVAALLTAVTVVMAPAVWRGGRRVDSWTPWRKLRFSLSTLIFAAFSVLLAYWGALEPWSG